MAMERQDDLLCLVDLGDDPGSYCSADSPAVLESIIRLGANDCVLTIRDATVIRRAMEVGVGSSLNVEAGASIDQRFYKPISISGTVKMIDDGTYTIMGPTHGGWGKDVRVESFREVNVGPRVLLRLRNNVDVIFSEGATGKDRDFFKSMGVALEAKKFIVVKSNQAHRASFDPIVADNIELDSPGTSTVNYSSLPYEKLQRPIYPIDNDMVWEPEVEG
jgi:microcystin degradation protein MlrC